MTRSSDIANPTGEAPRRSRRATLFAAFAATAIAAVAAWYLIVPYPWTLRTRDPGPTSLMKQRIREATERGEALEIRKEWIPLAEVSPALVRAVIVAEDYRFRDHHGVDWVSLAEEVRWTGGDELSWRSLTDLRSLADALRFAWANRAELRGRSTITQQLAKNLYFGTDRSIARKAMEMVVAGRLERRIGKDRILELYLNVAEWGPGVFGAEAAARTYFGRSARDLDLSEAAALAATLPHPLTSNPARDPGRMRWRQSLIVDRLDPSRGLPPPPGPLPEIEIELVDVDLESFDPTGAPDSMGMPEVVGAESDSSAAAPDSAR